MVPFYVKPVYVIWFMFRSVRCNCFRKSGMGRMLRIITFGWLSLVAPLHKIHATTCGSGITVFIKSQSNVDDFIGTYCDEFSGNIMIEDDNDGIDDITDLDPLNPVQSIGGDLIILNNNQLVNLNGLSMLTSIGGDLIIYQNLNLTGISGLNALGNVNGDLRIDLHPLLNGISGFSSLYSVSTFHLADLPLLSSLAAFSGLKFINGSLEIAFCSGLTNLTGLESLISLTGLIYLSTNSGLTSLDGLGALTTIGGFALFDNDALLEVNALTNIHSIPGGIRITGCDLLADLSGLGGITMVGGDIQISANPRLTDLSGLASVANLGGGILLSFNAGLSAIAAFSNLSVVTGELLLNSNPMLASLEEFGNLTSIGDNLTILNNNLLNNLDGLSQVHAVGGNLNVTENDLLSDCCALYELLKYMHVSGSVTISNNTSGCLSEADLFTTCNLLPVTLLSFEVELRSGQIEVKWTTAAEHQNDYFQIEHSSDGLEFNNVGIVQGAGDSDALNHYTFFQSNILPGIHYYRLKQVDVDGQFSYSPIRTVQYDNPQDFILYPNPSGDLINILTPYLAGSNQVLEVFSLLGEQLAVLPVKSGVTKINVGSWPAGIYQMRFWNNNSIQRILPFVKQL